MGTARLIASGGIALSASAGWAGQPLVSLSALISVLATPNGESQTLYGSGAAAAGASFETFGPTAVASSAARDWCSRAR